MKTRILAVLSILAFYVAAVSAQEYGQAGRIIKSGGAPVNGTNAVHTITLGGTPTGGTFTLTLNGETTAAITWTATDATLVSRIDTAIEALPSVGTSGVVTAAGTVSSGIGTVTVTFSGTNVAKRPIAVMTATSSLTGTSPTVTVGSTTTGVVPTGGAASEKGAILVRTDTGDGYINQGAPPNISWVKFTP